MSRIGVMICGHGSRDDAACVEFRRVVDQIADRLPEWPVAMGYLEFARPIIREGLDRAARPGRRPRAGGARHAVRRRAREERRALGAQRLRRRARHPARDGPRPRHRRQAAGGRARPDRRGPGARRERCRPGRDLPARGRPRHLGQRRQRQRRQGRPHAVGGHRLRPCRDRLFRRRPPAHRGGARARRAPGLPAHRRLPLLPVHRRPGPPDLRGRRRWSRRAIRRSSSSRRTISTTTRW